MNPQSKPYHYLDYCTVPSDLLLLFFLFFGVPHVATFISFFLSVIAYIHTSSIWCPGLNPQPLDSEP
jgi:hypothetical protein